MKMSDNLKKTILQKAAYLQSDGPVPGGMKGFAEIVLDRIEGKDENMELNNLQACYGYDALERETIKVLRSRA